MLGSFTDGGSTVLGLLSPHALAPRLGAETVSTLKLCVVQMRRALAEASGVPERRLRLSGAFLARLAPPPPKRRPRRRAALSASRPKPYWNVHVDAFNVESYEHTSLLYLGDDFDGGRFVMHDADADRVFAPSAGDLVLFSGDASNLHSVERVTRGRRFALTALFHEGDAPGPVFDDDGDDGGGDDVAASWDAALVSAAETSLMLQDPRRERLLEEGPAPLGARLLEGAPDIRTDWCDARVDYDAAPAREAGDSPVDAKLLALVDAVLALRAPSGPEAPAGWDAFGSDDDDTDTDDGSAQ